MASFFAFLAIVVLFIQLSDTRSRLKRAEAILAEAAKRIGALQRAMLPEDEAEQLTFEFAAKIERLKLAA